MRHSEAMSAPRLCREVLSQHYRSIVNQSYMQIYLCVTDVSLLEKESQDTE